MPTGLRWPRWFDVFKFESLPLVPNDRDRQRESGCGGGSAARLRLPDLIIAPLARGATDQARMRSFHRDRGRRRSRFRRLPRIGTPPDIITSRMLALDGRSGQDGSVMSLSTPPPRIELLAELSAHVQWSYPATKRDGFVVSGALPEAVDAGSLSRPLGNGPSKHRYYLTRRAA